MERILTVLSMMFAIVIVSCTNPEQATNEIEVADISTVEEPSLKEVFLSKFDSVARLNISIIDSFKVIHPDLAFDLKDRGIRLNFLKEKKWEEIQPETSSWQETEEFNDGMSSRSHTVVRHIGHAYLLEVKKDERWKNMMNEQDVFIEYVLQYGVLLSPDTLEGKIFPEGTFVLSHFTPKWKIDRGQYMVEYFSSYEKFIAAIYDNIKSASGYFDWMNSGDPKSIALIL